MTPERIRTWLSNRKPSGAQSVRLVVETPTGALSPIADWDRKSIDKDAEGVARDLSQQAQDYTDGETKNQKFLMQWMGTHDRVLKSCTHRCRPKGDDGEDLGDRSLQSELMTLLKDDRKVTNDALKTIFEAQKEVIGMLTDQLKEVHKLLNQKATPITSTTIIELTDEEKEESLQRAAAMGAFAEKLPAMIEVGVLAMGKHFGLLKSDEEMDEMLRQEKKAAKKAAQKDQN